MQHRLNRNSRAAGLSLPSSSVSFPHDSNNWNMVTSLILAVVLVLLVAAAVTTLAHAGGDNYLYHGDDGEQTSPVMEHLLPKDRPKHSGASSDAKDEEDGKDHPTPPEFLFPQGVARVVEFYAPWCGHCRHFKSHYVDLARETSRKLSDAGLQRVEFHAVSCVAHKELCHDHNVHAYPTVVACKMWSDCGASYDENGENGGKGSPVVLDKRLLTPEYVAEQLGIPLKGGESTAKAATDEQKQAAPGGKKEKKEARKKAMKDEMKRLGKKKALTDKIFNDEHAQTQESLYDDAAKSFYFSLEQGVYSSNGPLPAVRRGAFVDWINLLSRTLPEAWTDVQSTLDDLSGHLVEGEEESSIFKSEDGLMKVVNPHRKYDRRHDGWSANCSKKRGAGYTCGLWELFHIMSVGVAERNFSSSRDARNFSSSRGARDSRVSTLAAAEALRGFVANFFGCQECKTHFLDMYDSCKFDRCTRLNGEDASSESWREFALWLWEVHNDVNVRLRREEAERWGQQLTRRDEEEARWPSRTECGQCWHDDGTWNDNTVYLYLKHVYWPGGAGHASFLAGSGKPAAAIGGRRRKRRSFVFEKANGVATIILFFLALLLFVPILFHRKKVQWTGMHKKSDSTKVIV